MSVAAVRVKPQPAHGYIPLVVIDTGLVGAWTGFMVDAARKQNNVVSPQMYADKKEKQVKKSTACSAYTKKSPLFYDLFVRTAVVQKVNGK